MSTDAGLEPLCARCYLLTCGVMESSGDFWRMLGWLEVGGVARYSMAVALTV